MGEGLAAVVREQRVEGPRGGIGASGEEFCECGQRPGAGHRGIEGEGTARGLATGGEARQGQLQFGATRPGDRIVRAQGGGGLGGSKGRRHLTVGLQGIAERQPGRRGGRIAAHRIAGRGKGPGVVAGHLDDRPDGGHAGL
ncbi:MAG TPA: hypothetical protein PKD33_09705, partial [Rhodocyclaceae bacterium]|nr:hypothetical protein [Rhodocyclaceae bacterium]